MIKEIENNLSTLLINSTEEEYLNIINNHELLKLYDKLDSMDLISILSKDKLKDILDLTNSLN